MLPECNMLRVAQVFFDEPTQEHYLKEVSRKAGIAHTSVKNYIDELIKVGIVRRHVAQRGRRSFPLYRAAIDSDVFRTNKRVANFARIVDSGIVGFLRDAFMPRCILLFGSYNRGEDTEESDIDIFIEGTDKACDLSKFERKMRRKIQLHTRKTIGECGKELKNNIINGTVLYGYAEVFR